MIFKKTFCAPFISLGATFSTISTCLRYDSVCVLMLFFIPTITITNYDYDFTVLRLRLRVNYSRAYRLPTDVPTLGLEPCTTTCFDTLEIWKNCVMPTRQEASTRQHWQNLSRVQSLLLLRPFL